MCRYLGPHSELSSLNQKQTSPIRSYQLLKQTSDSNGTLFCVINRFRETLKCNSNVRPTVGIILERSMAPLLQHSLVVQHYILCSNCFVAEIEIDRGVLPTCNWRSVNSF